MFQIMVRVASKVIYVEGFPGPQFRLNLDTQRIVVGRTQIPEATKNQNKTSQRVGGLTMK